MSIFALFLAAIMLLDWQDEVSWIYNSNHNSTPYLPPYLLLFLPLSFPLFVRLFLPPFLSFLFFLYHISASVWVEMMRRGVGRFHALIIAMLLSRLTLGKRRMRGEST